MKCFYFIAPLFLALIAFPAQPPVFSPLPSEEGTTNSPASATTAFPAQPPLFSPLPPEEGTTNSPATAPTPAPEENRTNDPGSIEKAAAAYESGQSLEPFRQIEQGLMQSEGKPAVRKEIESALIELLGTNATFEARKFAAKQLSVIGSQAALPALSKLLQDPETTGIGCLALTTYPPGKADEILRRALNFAQGNERAQILNTLGDRGDAKSISLFAHSANDSDPGVAEAAIASLGKIASPAALKEIRRINIAGRPELKPALMEATLRCADALTASGETKAAAAVYEELLQKSDQIAVRRSALSTLLQMDKDGGERRILEVLSGTNSALKAVAIRKIASVPGRSASEKFGIQMHKLRPHEQALVVASLAQRGDDAARLEIAKSLSSPEVVVRRAAVAALGKMGDPYFVGLLAGAAASTDAEEAKAAEAALVVLHGGHETDERLMAELKTSMPKGRVALINALAQRRGVSANSILLEEVANSDPAVARAALRALARTGTSAQAEPLIAKMASIRDPGLRQDAQSTASQLLAKMESPAARFGAVKPALEQATTAESRVILLQLLPACGDNAALVFLKTATTDPDDQVREAAFRALADWPDDAAWDTLLSIYRKPETEQVRGLALRGLVRLLSEHNSQPDATLLGRYRELFASARSEADLKLLLGTLSSVPDPDALGLVIPLLSHTGVHMEAAAAANGIVETIKVKRPELAEEAMKRLQQKQTPAAPDTTDGAQTLN